MKPFLILTCFGLMISTTVLAEDTSTTTETCANGAGTVVIGAITGHKYCKSNNTMNYWNAHAWCDAQGRQLFDLSDCGCDGTRTCQAQGTSGLCPELKNVYGTSYDSYGWTSLASSESTAYYVSLTIGAVLNGYSTFHDYKSYRNSSHRQWALCK